MADKIVIAGARPYDGEYDLDFVGEPLTTLEWRWIKKISGYLPLTVGIGWTGEDPDLFLAFAVIGLRRAGKIEKGEALSAAERMEDSAKITLVFEDEEEEVEADPPVPAPEQPSKSDDFGGPSSPTSELPGPTPLPTGSHGSERSAA